MSTRTGLFAQLGVGVESTYGTAVAPTRSFPFVSESLQLKIDRIEARGLRAGRLTASDVDWVAGNRWVEGSVEMEVQDRGMTPWFLSLLGANVDAGSGPYTHTLTPATSVGDSLSIDVGRPMVASGTVQGFRYSGCKISRGQLSLAVGELAMATFDVLGRDEVVGAVGATTYLAGSRPIAFTAGTVTVGGSSVNVRSAQLTIANSLAQRRFLGSALLSEPLTEALLEVTGQLEMEFEDTTQLNRYLNATQAAVVLTLGAGSNQIAVTMNCRFDGTTPNVSGPGIVPLTLPFKAVGTTDAAAITVVVTDGVTPGF